MISPGRAVGHLKFLSRAFARCSSISVTSFPIKKKIRYIVLESWRGTLKCFWCRMPGLKSTASRHSSFSVQKRKPPSNQSLPVQKLIGGFALPFVGIWLYRLYSKLHNQHFSAILNGANVNYNCTMLLEQIKGFYHGITKIFLLVDSYTMLSWHF